MEIIWQINDQAKVFFGWMSNTKVWGIPINIPAHILVSACIYYYLAGKNIRTLYCVLIVLFIGCCKEIYDLTAVFHSGDYMDPVRSMSGNIVGVLLGYYLSRKVEVD